MSGRYYIGKIAKEILVWIRFIFIYLYYITYLMDMHLGRPRLLKNLGELKIALLKMPRRAVGELKIALLKWPRRAIDIIAEPSPCNTTVT